MKHLALTLLIVGGLAACSTSQQASQQTQHLNDTTSVIGQPPAHELTPTQPTQRSAHIALPYKRPERASTIVADTSTARSVPGMSKRRISLDIRNAQLDNVLRLFAKEGHINIIADPDVSGEVTLSVRDAPIDQVFLSVMSAHDLGFERRGNIIRVAKRERLAAQASL